MERHIRGEKQMSEKKTKALEVVEIKTGKTVRTIPVSGTERMIERTLMGLLRNMDTERFFVREVTE